MELNNLEKLKHFKENITHVIKDDNELNKMIEDMTNNGISFDKSINYAKQAFKYMNLIYNHSLPKRDKSKDIISKEDSIKYARIVIESIDQNLIKEFDLFINSDSFIFHNSFLPNNIIKNKSCFDFDDDTINLFSIDPYTDICIIVHEFMHYTNSKNSKNKSALYDYLEEGKYKSKYTEFISIYFEKYARDFLVNNYNLPLNSFNNRFRLENIYGVAKLNLEFLLPFYIHDKYGKYNYENYLKTIEEEDLVIPKSKQYYDKIHYNVIKTYRETKEIFYDFLKHPNLVNKNLNLKMIQNIIDEPFEKRDYFISTLLAYKDDIKKEDVLKLSYLLNEPCDVIKKDPIFIKMENNYKSILEDNKVLTNIEVDLIRCRIRGKTI